MYCIAMDTSLKEEAVLFVISELCEKHDKFGYNEMAERLNCSWITVHRACKRLLEAKRITRTGSRRTGYRYEVNHV